MTTSHFGASTIDRKHPALLAIAHEFQQKPENRKYYSLKIQSLIDQILESNTMEETGAQRAEGGLLNQS
jgi:hypothetical protein